MRMKKKKKKTDSETLKGVIARDSSSVFTATLWHSSHLKTVRYISPGYTP